MTRASPTTVEGVLEYYTSEVVPALAAALTVDDAFPQEVLNEIRNSYTHLARANKLGPGNDDYSKEIDGAYRHLKRTCLDCMKVCVSVLATRADNVIAVLQEDLQLPNNVYTRIQALRRQRSALSAYEGEHPTHEAVAKYKELFNEYDQFYQSLDAEFTGSTAEERKKARQAKEDARQALEEARRAQDAADAKRAARKSLVYGFFVGAAASAVVTLGFNYGMGAWPFSAPPAATAAEPAASE
jgi:hypothetical protein